MKLEPEKFEGKVEYKLKLVESDVDQLRIEQLTTQMRFRCNQGGGECIYNIGVRDNGTLEGITEDEYNDTIKYINIIAEKNNYSVKVLNTCDVSKGKKVYEVLIREINDNKYIDLIVVVAGAVDASKSTTVSSLTTGCIDDGRGLSRTRVFNYLHEIKSGRTSSISQQIMGYDNNGNIINYRDNNTWEDIVNKSSKIVTFLDLAGHETYLKTTILGIASSRPDICLIIVSANNGVSTITKEHIFLCVTMKIPFVIVISKIDICKDRQNVLNETLVDVYKILQYPSIRRHAVHIKTIDDIILSAKNMYSETIVPIFYISNVTGEGLDNVRTFLNILGKRNTINYSNEPVEFSVESIFNVRGFGLVVGGYLYKGKVSVGDKLFIGPFQTEYQSFIVKSIYCKKVPVDTISCGAYVCIGVKKKMPVKRGHVILGSIEEHRIIKTFKAKVRVLKSNVTTVKIGYEPILHTSTIRETVRIVSIDDKQNGRKRNHDEEDKILRSGDTALVTLEFKYNHHYLKSDTRILLCEGITKIVGDIVDIA